VKSKGGGDGGAKPPARINYDFDGGEFEAASNRLIANLIGSITSALSGFDLANVFNGRAPTSKIGCLKITDEVNFTIAAL
jgi:hypothetical protein